MSFGAGKEKSSRTLDKLLIVEPAFGGNLFSCCNITFTGLVYGEVNTCMISSCRDMSSSALGCNSSKSPANQFTMSF